MVEENNQKPKKRHSQKAKELIKCEKVQMEKGETLSGAEAFARFFNGLVDEVQLKADKEMLKPKYRFLEKLSNSNYDIDNALCDEAFLDEMDELQQKLVKHRYNVEIIEDLDCKDVTKGNRYIIRIENTNGVYVDIDLYTYQRDIKDFSFNEQDFIEERLAKIVGCNTTQTKEAAEVIVDYIAHIMYFRELYTLTYRKIGWDTYNWRRAGYIFKYDKVYSNILLLKGRGKPAYADGLEISSNSMQKELEWIDTTINLLNNHAYCGLILGAGISGVIRQLLPYTKETNININICGKPGSGKSTIGHYLLGIFGNPEKLEGSFTDTANSMEEMRVKRPILPYVLDERMLKIENASVETKKQTVLMDIFREYEGKVKERVGKQYEESSGERTYGPIISSSVREMMEYVFKSDDLGQYRRFMEFDIGRKEDGLLFSDSKEAEKAEQVAYANYGFGIRIIVDYMLNMTNLLAEQKDGTKNNKNTDNKASTKKFIPLPDLLLERFNTINDEINAKLKKCEEQNKQSGLTSSSKRFALIVLSYQILREAIIYYKHCDFVELEEAVNNKLDAIYLKIDKTKQRIGLDIESNSNIKVIEAEIQKQREDLREKLKKLKETQQQNKEAIREKELLLKGIPEHEEEVKKQRENLSVELKDLQDKQQQNKEAIQEKELLLKDIIKREEVIKKAQEDLRETLKKLKETQQQNKEAIAVNEVKLDEIIKKIEGLIQIKKYLNERDKLLEITEQIANSVEFGTFTELETFANIKERDKILADKSDEIEELLIENLELKFKKLIIIKKDAKNHKKSTNDKKLFDYILSNSRYFLKKSKSLEASANIIYDNADKYLGFYEKKGQKIILYTIEKYRLHRFWDMESIPKPEELLKHMKNIDNGITKPKDFPSFKTDNNNKRSNYKIDSKKDGTENFHKKELNYVIPIVEEKDKGKEEGES